MTSRSGDNEKKPKFWTLFHKNEQAVVRFFKILFHTEQLHEIAVREKKSSSKSVHGFSSYLQETEPR